MELFWARRFSGVCVLFLVLRYLVLAVLLVCMLAYSATLSSPVGVLCCTPSSMFDGNADYTRAEVCLYAPSTAPS